MTIDSILQSLPLKLPSPLQELEHELFSQKSLRVFVKRDDLIHPLLSGNKWRKLKFNLYEAERHGKQTLLSFGGAYSNHIHALAAAAKIFGFKSIGVIRGEPYESLNPTLAFAKAQSMVLHYLDRETYRKKNTSEVLDSLLQQYGDCYVIPEGGSNTFALPGCAEIVSETYKQIATEKLILATAVGSGGTAAGLLSHASKPAVLGVAVLKNANFLQADIGRLLGEEADNFQLNLDFHFGGYAKWNRALMDFIDEFKRDFGIQLEPIYTGKLFYALFELMRQDYFEKGSTIVALHTGGLQGMQYE